jgi:hypothetical protein
MSNKAKRYVTRRNLRHILPINLEEAYDAGVNSMGKRYFDELSDQPIIAQLQQLTQLTFDGDLIGKSHRDELVKIGFAVRFDGWNIITKSGVQHLNKLKFIHP